MTLKNLDELLNLARKTGPLRVAVAAAQGLEVLTALREAEQENIVESVLIGDEQAIHAICERIDFKPRNLIHEPDKRKAAFKAVQMITNGDAQLIMKGKMETVDLLKAVLDRDTGLRQAGRLLSQVILFEAPGMDRLMFLTDTSVNIAPNLLEKAEICKNIIRVAHAVGFTNPKLAALATLEFVNPQIPSTIDAACLTQMNRRGQIEGAIIDGPLALDACLSHLAAEQKGINSPIAGETDLLVAPNLDSANILYRSIIYYANARNCGFVTGARVPLILLSRAESAETKLFSIALSKVMYEFERAEGLN